VSPPEKENLVTTTTSLLPDVGVELREGYAEVGDVNLHYVEAGEGPLVRQSQKEAVAKLRAISAPTLVIWGERDSYLGSDLAEPHADDVPNLDRVERLADASHWVHHDEAERVNELLIDFFNPSRGG
jgi:pimeloyl-ACP methyl ester carboxylesterase